MKTKLLALVLLFSSSSLLSQESSQAMKVTYELTSTTSYNVSQTTKDNMKLYDKIRLMPSVTLDSYAELFFSDGSTEKTIYHTFPNGLPEKWLTKPTKTVITKDSVFVYVENEIFSRFKFQEQELIPAKEAVSYYLGTPLWILPLKEEEINLLENQDAQIIINEDGILEYIIDETTFYYNADLLIQEISITDGVRDVEKHTTAYQRDANGHILMYYEIQRSLQYDSNLNDYVETVYSSNYENIVREFIDPSLEPLVEYPQNEITPCITASQLGATNEIKVNFKEDCPEGDFLIKVTDLQGNVKLNNVIISKDYPTFFIENCQLGVHVITVLSQTVPACTFMYIP